MFQYPDKQLEQQTLTLRELNFRVKSAIQGGLPGMYWLRAETSDVRVNHSSGHCYLEFVEKNTQTGQIIAKARASIWAKTFAMLKPYFEKETGQAFVSGLTVLVKVSVDFHELYGFSLTVYDIDPSYTLGDIARKRLEIVKRLKEDGIFELNKELSFPSLPRRIAIITSPTAAGYEDFINQLQNNDAGYTFYVKLFPALMQGERTEESVISALDRIYTLSEHFDVVTIIRGGGSTSDLSSFDSYLLAANCAQFPLPIITGIGHERDETVLDMVAHARMKTPTAVAEYLISKMDIEEERIDELYQRLISYTETKLTEQKTLVQLIASRLPVTTLGKLEKSKSEMQTLKGKFSTSTISLLASHQASLKDRSSNFQRLIKEKIQEGANYLNLTEQFVKMASPAYILKRGYSLTIKEGKILKSASSFSAGEKIVTRFADGEVTSLVTEVNKK